MSTACVLASPSPALVALAALGLALAIDRWLGEPPARWHPVVWMGAYLDAAGRLAAPREGQGNRARAVPFMLGALGWTVGATASAVAGWAVQWHALHHLPGWCAALVLALAFKPLFAWRMLRAEALAVDAALVSSLAAGRARLAQLVSRDVDALDEAGVRESAIESLAENVNDSVVAPLFWFVVAGLPGAALYRFANTADAMWGYRGARAGREWEWAGKWAARADDVLSWLPARLTGVLLGLVARGSWRRAGFRMLRREAARTPSPNSGWPMAAMALRLGVRLGKPGVYTLNAGAGAPVAGDVQRAVQLAAQAVTAWAAVAALAIVLLVVSCNS